ncbi:UvrD-helicase domain-containing protein [Silvimonas sp.]|uniref:UvrD-helicase domain-containing protein n=1 Tax=Silvimonas sp. TaxID=2650811 RepID=UPI00284FD617|nr:UvrD-helicase domain-containing protein [Silvimonas sp.]MDR3428226.1 AAA family ATPase [Silvimonas sp.]
MSLKPKVALAQDFLSVMARLPNTVQGKILKWAIKFQSDPTSSGINYENINAARDSNLKSVRIDQDWRGIVFKPSQGDVYVLLYVDHHDDAYLWAENRKIAINPVTGAMQIVLTEHVSVLQEPVTATAVAAAEKAPSPFTTLSNQELMSVGVPEDLLPAVRQINDETDLDGMHGTLPVEAYEALFLFLAGDSISQILVARETRVDVAIDVTDFAGALDRAESQSRFVIVEDDEALSTIMNAPLAQWRVFLHPTQRKLATKDFSGPARVLGGAGTGKTVLAIHRAKWLAENRTQPAKRVLFTTFTKNLAIDVKENLMALCSAETMKAIEVINLDAWVHGYLRSKRYEHTIVYNRHEGAAEDAWQLALAAKDPALDLPANFYETELDQVILAQGISSRDEYRQARRAGRGVVLTRSKRDAAWPVFEEYRTQLTSRKLKEVDDAYRDAASLLAQDEMHGKYSAIVVDETQDLGPQAIRLLRAMIAPSPNDLFFVGDGHQRIYGRNKTALSRCGVDIRGRSRKLYINYRTTDEIRRAALSYLEGCEIDDLDDGSDESKRYKSLSHGPAPVVERFGNLEEVSLCLSAWIGEYVEGESERWSTCVIASSKQLRDFARALSDKKGLKTSTVEASQSCDVVPGTVYFSTMHRAKGLEFDQVIVLSRQELLSKDNDEGRKLLYVAITRARRESRVVFL